MKKFIEWVKSLDLGTILRTVFQILVYVNQLVALLGQQSFANAPWYQWLSFGLTVAITVIGFWFNNDWTNGAILVRDIFDMLKDGKLTQDEVKEFIEKYKLEEKQVENKEIKEIEKNKEEK